jgi:hypothetical protein
MATPPAESDLPHRRTTFSKFIIEEETHGDEPPDPALTGLLNDVQTACKFIALAVSRGALHGTGPVGADLNVQGEVQKPLDVISNDIMLQECARGGTVCGMASEELAEPYVIPHGYKRGHYLLAFDPLDGSSNLDVNVTVGTIFSVMRAPEGVTEPEAHDFYQPDDRADARARRPRLHARPRDRRVHAHASGYAHSGDDPRVCDQRLQRTLLGAAGPPLRGGMHRRQERSAR